MKRALPLILLAACSSLPVESRAVKQQGPGGEEWSFEFTNNTGVVINLLEMHAGSGGRLRSVGGFAEMAHATTEQKSMMSPGETLHTVRSDGTDEVLIIYCRDGVKERCEARVKAKLD